MYDNSEDETVQLPMASQPEPVEIEPVETGIARVLARAAGLLAVTVSTCAFGLLVVFAPTPSPSQDTTAQPEAVILTSTVTNFVPSPQTAEAVRQIGSPVVLPEAKVTTSTTPSETSEASVSVSPSVTTSSVPSSSSSEATTTVVSPTLSTVTATTTSSPSVPSTTEETTPVVSTESSTPTP